MRLLTISFFTVFLCAFCNAQTVKMTWDIYAEKMPSSMHIQLVADGEVMQDLDLRGSNALQFDLPVDKEVTLYVSTPDHKFREVQIDTHHALDNAKQAKQNKKFAFDLYLEGKKEDIDPADLLRSVSFEAGTSKILFDELVADEQD